MMKIKLAESTQLSAVYRFYREICEALKGQNIPLCGCTGRIPVKRA